MAFVFKVKLNFFVGAMAYFVPNRFYDIFTVFDSILSVGTDRVSIIAGTSFFVIIEKCFRFEKRLIQITKHFSNNKTGNACTPQQNI